MKALAIFVAVIAALTVVTACTYIAATDRPCPPGQGLVYVQGSSRCAPASQWGSQP